MNTFRNLQEMRDEYKSLYSLNDMVGGKGKIDGQVVYHWYRYHLGKDYERVGTTRTLPAGAHKIGG